MKIRRRHRPLRPQHNMTKQSMEFQRCAAFNRVVRPLKHKIRELDDAVSRNRVRSKEKEHDYAALRVLVERLLRYAKESSAVLRTVSTEVYSHKQEIQCLREQNAFLTAKLHERPAFKVTKW